MAVGYTYDSKQKSMAFWAYPPVSLADARSERDEACTAVASASLQSTHAARRSAKE